jgi:hypothetical protein
MIIAYGEGHDGKDIIRRGKLLAKGLYSVIVETEWMEFDNLKRWMSLNIQATDQEYVSYGKIGYNFGFFEFFFERENDMLRTLEAIPRIYTIYPHSLTPAQPIRSIGYEGEQRHDPNDVTAIIFSPEED